MAEQRASLLDGLSTHIGPLSPPQRLRLRRVLVDPTQETWDASDCIILRSTTASRGSLKCHRTRNAIGFVSASSTAGGHNLDLLLHRPSNPGAVLKRVVSKLPSADAR